VEGPFVAAKKKTRQTAAQSRQYPFAVRSCFSLSTRNEAFAVWRQVNTAFSKLLHTMCFGIPYATSEKNESCGLSGLGVDEEVSWMLETGFFEVVNCA
jgi:hypothetical protein